MRVRPVLIPTLLAVSLAACSRDTPAGTTTPSATAVPGSTSAPAVAATTATTTPAGSTSDSSAPASATVSRPTAPAAATKRTPQDAADFVAYYFRAVDHAFRTGDVVPLRRASTATNRTTEDFASRAAAMHRQGSTPLGATQSVQVATSTTMAPHPGAASTVQVTARYSSPAVGVVDQQHRTVSAPAVPERTITVTVLWLAGHWLVDAVTDPAATSADTP